MLVGLLSQQNLLEYQSLISSAPVRCLDPLVVMLSSPDEVISPEFQRTLETSRPNLRMRPGHFRHLYDPTISRSTFCASMHFVTEEAVDRNQLLGIIADTYEPDFIPYAPLMMDGMQSRASRMFCRSLGNALPDYLLTFDVYWADLADPELGHIAELYNPEASRELAGTLGLEG